MPLVIREHRPIRQILIVFIIVLLVALVFWLLRDLGSQDPLGDVAAVRESDESAARSLETAKKLNASLALMERATEIDKLAYLALKNTVGEQQGEILKLKEELEFYQGVLANAKRSGGLEIQGVRIQALGRDNRYYYKLVLTNVVKDDSRAVGNVSVAIHGRDASNELSLRLVDLVEGEPDFSFDFKHFRRLEGVFTLPRGFTPSRISVAVRKGKSAKLQRSFNWVDLSK